VRQRLSFYINYAKAVQKGRPSLEAVMEGLKKLESSETSSIALRSAARALRKRAAIDHGRVGRGIAHRCGHLAWLRTTVHALFDEPLDHRLSIEEVHTPSQILSIIASLAFYSAPLFLPLYLHLCPNCLKSSSNSWL
jgi:hypothetical protein